MVPLFFIPIQNQLKSEKQNMQVESESVSCIGDRLDDISYFEYCKQ